MGSPLLHMDYFDKNGKKWSIENGDWISHQAERKKVKKINHEKIFNKRFIILFIVIIVLISCYITVL